MWLTAVTLHLQVCILGPRSPHPHLWRPPGCCWHEGSLLRWSRERQCVASVPLGLISPAWYPPSSSTLSQVAEGPVLLQVWCLNYVPLCVVPVTVAHTCHIVPIHLLSDDCVSRNLAKHPRSSRCLGESCVFCVEGDVTDNRSCHFFTRWVRWLGQGRALQGFGEWARLSRSCS